MSCHNILLIGLILFLLFLIYRKNDQCMNKSNSIEKYYRGDYADTKGGIYVIFKDINNNYRFDYYMISRDSTLLYNIISSTKNNTSFAWKCENDPIYMNNPSIQYVYKSYFQSRLLRSGERLMEPNAMIRYNETINGQTVNVIKDIVIGVGVDGPIVVPTYSTGYNTTQVVKIQSPYVINVNNGNKLMNKIIMLKSDILNESSLSYLPFADRNFIKNNNVYLVTEEKLSAYIAFKTKDQQLTDYLNNKPKIIPTEDPEKWKTAYKILQQRLKNKIANTGNNTLAIYNNKPDYTIPPNIMDKLNPNLTNVPYNVSQLNLSDQNEPLLQSFVDANKALAEAAEAVPPEEINAEINKIFEEMRSGKIVGPSEDEMRKAISDRKNNEIYQQLLSRITTPLVAGSQPDPSSTLTPTKMGSRDYGSNNWTVYTGKAATINNNWRSGYYLSTKNLANGAQSSGGVQSSGMNTADVVTNVFTMIIDIGTWNFKNVNLFVLATALDTPTKNKTNIYTSLDGTDGLFNNSPLMVVGTDNIWDKVPKFNLNYFPPENISQLSISLKVPTVYKIIITPQDVADKKRYITLSHSRYVQSALLDVIFDM